MVWKSLMESRRERVRNHLSQADAAEKASIDNPDDTENLKKWAYALSQAGHIPSDQLPIKKVEYLKAAQSKLDHVLEIDPNDHDAIFYLGLVHYYFLYVDKSMQRSDKVYSDHFAKALECFRKVYDGESKIFQEPGDHDVFVLLKDMQYILPLDFDSEYSFEKRDDMADASDGSSTDSRSSLAWSSDAWRSDAWSSDDECSLSSNQSGRKSGKEVVEDPTPELSDAVKIATMMFNFNRLVSRTKGRSKYVDRIMNFIASEVEFIDNNETQTRSSIPNKKQKTVDQCSSQAKETRLLANENVLDDYENLDGKKESSKPVSKSTRQGGKKNKKKKKKKKKR